MLPPAAFPGLLVLGACSSAYNMAMDDADTAGAGEDAAGAGDTAATGDTAGSSSAAYWDLEGQLELVEGQPAVVELSATLYGPAGRDGAICTVELLPDALVPTDVLPAEELLAWWQVRLAERGEEACPQASALPTTFQLGIGSLLPDVAGLLPRFSLGGLEANLNGAYYSPSDTADPLWIYGVAGTEEQFAGQAPAARDALPDGSYQLVAFYLLPLEGSD